MKPPPLPCHKETDLFFPEEETEENTAEAKALCFMCPVKSLCLRTALGYTDEWETVGVWGATTTAERRLLKKEVQI